MKIAPWSATYKKEGNTDKPIITVNAVKDKNSQSCRLRQGSQLCLMSVCGNELSFVKSKCYHGTYFFSCERNASNFSKTLEN